MWCPDRMGGADAAEGPDAAGLSDTFGYIFVLGNTFFVLAVCLRKIISNFLKLSFFFTFLSGVPDAAGLSDTFLVLEILVEKKLSQILSNFLGIHFYVLAMAENYLKISQIFSNFLKSFSIFSVFSQKMSLFVPGGVRGGRVHIGGVCRDTCLVFVVFGHM